VAAGLRGLVATAFVAILVGCAAPTPTAAPTVAPDETPPTAPFFPMHNIGRFEPFPSALIVGSLVRVGACLLVRNEFGDEDLVVWPSWLRMVSDNTAVADDRGHRALVGGPIEMGGGEFPWAFNWDKVLAGAPPPPPECRREHYWLSSGFVD
jgi:hypothetical protein